MLENLHIILGQHSLRGAAGYEKYVKMILKFKITIDNAMKREYN